MSDTNPSLFSDSSAFNQVPNNPRPEVVKDIEDKIGKITSAMNIDLESMYQKLDEALLYINDPAASRLVEDVRDDIYKNLR